MSEEMLHEELKRKDEIIKKLKEENTILMKLSLKSAGERAELAERIKKLEEK